MYERFSDRARHAMALANLEASKLKHDYLAPAHLMLGLIAEGGCVATEALRQLDVDLQRVRDDVCSRMKEGAETGSLGRRAHTKAMKSVTEAAIQEARKLGHHSVGTEHLLIAMLCQKDAIPARVLHQLGISVDDLRERSLAMLRDTADHDGDASGSRGGDFEWVHQQELAKAFRSQTFWHTLILAVDSANRLGAGEVEPLHLLLGLLRDPKNGVAELLQDKGVTADWVREQIAARHND